MPHHVRANLVFAHTLGYFVLAPEVCFQDQQSEFVSPTEAIQTLQTGVDTSVLADF
jgi:hypothetical protein